MADRKVSVANGEESESHTGSDPAGSGPRRRPDAGATEEAFDASSSPAGVSDGSDPERDQEGSDGDHSSDPGSEVASARQAVAEAEEILDGEIDDPGQIERIISEQHWEGPLPPPAALAAYEHVLPGAADRAFTLAERNMDLKHVRAETVRIAVEGEVNVNTITATNDGDALKRGQYLASGISALIGALSFAGLFLTPWAAIGFTVPLAQVAGALIRTVSDRRIPEIRGDAENKSDPDRTTE